MIRHLCLLGALWGAAQITCAQEPDGSCASQARTELERTFCKIKAANPGAALPSLQELRRNPERTQRLLLRRPAEQAGIKLPPETTARPATTAAAKTAPEKSAARTGVPAPAVQPTTSAGGSPLGHCRLEGASISCGSDTFRLQGNLPNSRLAQGALDPARKIDFAEFSGDGADQAQVMPYLAQTYQKYLESMLDIGLGASTMSFTKFHHTFMEAQNKGTDFGKRLSAMFDFLKQDKTNMGVQTHYNDEMPQSLAQCMGLGDHLLVCDNVQQNWVYKKTGP